MVNHHIKMIYLHIPRTGGHSIQKLFGGRQTHGNKRYYIQKCGQEIWDSYFKFATARNPWDRWVSIYFYSKKYRMVDNLDFPEWIKRKHELHVKNNGNPSKMDRQWPHLYIPQISWITENGKKVVDSIIKIENYKKELEKALNIKIETMPHAHRTTHSPYYTLYDDKTTTLVAEMSKQDIEYLGYEFK